jgi:hypothetical protein
MWVFDGTDAGFAHVVFSGIGRSGESPVESRLALWAGVLMGTSFARGGVSLSLELFSSVYTLAACLFWHDGPVFGLDAPDPTDPGASRILKWGQHCSSLPTSTSYALRPFRVIPRRRSPHPSYISGKTGPIRSGGGVDQRDGSGAWGLRAPVKKNLKNQVCLLVYNLTAWSAK